tara:strand:- start:121 stop:507 length:387 start_codon:yes stop_codon:yes gene_type:complete
MIEEINIEGASEEYKYFKYLEDNSRWKVAVKFEKGRKPLIKEDTEVLAPVEMKVIVSVSCVNSSGKAKSINGNPVVFDAHSHNFNNKQLSDPDFDARQSILKIIEDLIVKNAKTLKSLQDLEDLQGEW